TEATDVIVPKDWKSLVKTVSDCPATTARAILFAADPSVALSPNRWVRCQVARNTSSPRCFRSWPISDAEGRGNGWHPGTNRTQKVVLPPRKTRLYQRIEQGHHHYAR